MNVMWNVRLSASKNRYYMLRGAMARRISGKFSCGGSPGKCEVIESYPIYDARAKKQFHTMRIAVFSTRSR
jgi:hypothetical protein